MARKVRQHIQVHTAIGSMCAKPSQGQENCLIQKQILLCLEKDLSESINNLGTFMHTLLLMGHFS